jgi:hypothetical protein
MGNSGRSAQFTTLIHISLPSALSYVPRHLTTEDQHIQVNRWAAGSMTQGRISAGWADMDELSSYVWTSPARLVQAIGGAAARTLVAGTKENINCISRVLFIRMLSILSRDAE